MNDYLAVVSQLMSLERRITEVDDKLNKIMKLMLLIEQLKEKAK